MNSSFSYPITFLPCIEITEIRSFYEGILGLQVALEQGKCIIFKIGQEPHYGYWGFCSHYKEQISSPERICLTLVVDNKNEVDSWHNKLLFKKIECSKIPAYTREFKIYNAFYKDPMNYTIEIQAFDQNSKPIGG